MRIRNPIKLTSLHLRARAEPCRLLLTYSGYKFTEERIPCSHLGEVLDPDNRPILNWGGGTIICDPEENMHQNKAAVPAGVNVISEGGEIASDGSGGLAGMVPTAAQMRHQEQTINRWANACEHGCRFIARELDIMGATKFEQAQVDAIVDVLEDTLNNGYSIALIKDEVLKESELKKYHEESVPAMLQYLENRITENGGLFLVGNELTWADIHLFYFATQGHMLKMVKVPKLSTLVQKVGKIQEFEFFNSHYRPETKF